MKTLTSMQNNSNARLTALLFIATLIVFLPTWLWLGEAWLSDPYYSHGPLVIVIALYLIWTHRAVLKSPPAPNNWGWLIVAVSLLVHLWAIVWRAFYISALMIPLTFFGLLITLYGIGIAKKFWFPLAFLILMVPLPLAERFGPMLESWAATSATALAQLLGVAARNEGSQVFLPNSTFTVGIPCGGLRSVIAIITLATLFAYIVNGAWWARLLIFFTAIPIALAANTMRIALLFAIANAWGADIALNYFHDWSSPILFLLAFGLIILLAKLLGSAQIRWEVVIAE